METRCEASDLLRAKVMYDSLDRLRRGAEAVEDICHRNEYTILEMENRLMNTLKRDVVFKIQIREAVCEFKLKMKEEESQHEFIHSIQEI